MKDILKKVKSKYIIQNIFGYLQFKKTIKIVKYNKKLINKLDYLYEDVKIFLFFSKIIKPISNCEDYLPIIKRILFKKVKMKKITNLFCEFLNKNNNEFIPQINQIKGNEDILDQLKFFKLGFNDQLLEYFYNLYNEDENLYFLKLSEFCKKYGKKIKEITFMDNKISEQIDCDICCFTIKYIINNSKIEKIEDRFYDENTNSIFTDIYDLYYDELFEEDYLNNFGENKNKKKITDIIKELKSYSLYFDKINNFKLNELVSAFCGNILKNGKKIEELEITKINKNNGLFFIHSIKNLSKLKSLIISCKSKNKLFFNRLAKRIKKDSLHKLEININNYIEGYRIINKNTNSLIELTLKISNKTKNNIIIIKTISNIINLKKLKLINEFEIFDDDNIKYLSLKNVEYLEIPLFVENYLFDLNLFFEKIPKLKKIIFNGINFGDNNDIKWENINKIYEFKINNIKYLKKITFINSKKNSSFFIIKLIELFSKTNFKEKIKKIKIENCDLGKEINFFNLIKLISLFTNIKSLSLNNLSFEDAEVINYDEINKFENLEKFYFKGLDYEKNEIKIIYFLYKFSEKCKSLNELGFSCKGLNPYDINLIFQIIQNYRLLTKLNIFDNYSKSDYFTNEEYKFYLSGINIGGINNFCMLDLRNIDLKVESMPINFLDYNEYKKNSINYFFDIKKNSNNLISNKKEKYYFYQNIYNNSYLNKLFYSGTEKSFIIGDINNFSQNELEEKPFLE